MTAIIFNQQIATELYESKEQFPVDLDDAWVWLGFTRKENAKSLLTNNFEEGADFFTKGCKNSDIGRSSEQILLTVDCLKCMGMMAKTDQGKLIRTYFLNCEAIAKRFMADNEKYVRANELMLRIIQDIDELDKISYVYLDETFKKLNMIYKVDADCRLKQAEIEHKLTTDKYELTIKTLKSITDRLFRCYTEPNLDNAVMAKINNSTLIKEVQIELQQVFQQSRTI